MTNDRGVGCVDSHFNDRGGDHEGRFAARKITDGFFFRFTIELAVGFMATRKPAKVFFVKWLNTVPMSLSSESSVVG